MTDKQIMIDGVDVSKCIFFDKNYKEDGVQIKNFCELQYISCKEFDCANCYFKKWKRKEQECEKKSRAIGCLEYKIKNQRKEINIRLEQLDQLKKTNEELKKCYKNNSALLDFEETNTTKLVNKVIKLEKTLTEIKEITEPYFTIASKDSPVAQILQKISECEAEYEN